MKTVLLVDGDKPWIACIEDYLTVYASHIEVLTANDGDKAIEIINSRQVDLVITDLEMHNMDGYELVSRLNSDHPDVTVIVNSALNESEVREILNSNASYRYLQKPLQMKTLTEEIVQVLNEDSRGYVHGFTLANFLQLVEMEQKTCTLLVESNNKTGYLHIKNGKLIDAEMNGYAGMEAAIRIIGWESAYTKIQRFRGKKTTIDLPIMQLLLKATCHHDENCAQIDQENMLQEAIMLAEGHHFKRAMASLARLLKKNPRSHIGWLWYARISENMKAVRSGLRNAAKLAPHDPEIAEEINKLGVAKGVSHDHAIERCPICWCPLQIGSIQCDYCAASLHIHSEVFKNVGGHKKNLLNQAAKRLQRVVSRENNSAAHYFLAIVYLNRKNWEKALHHLDTAVKLAPDNEDYSQQLAVLLNYMASSDEGAGVETGLTADARASGVATPAGDAKRTILVVEDSPTTRKVIAITLGQQGFNIVEAGDGLEALSKLNDVRPDLMLLDIILPKMDGYKILSIIKNNPDLREIPVIMLTSKNGILNKVKGKVSGCEAYLTKPFDPRELIETVEKYT